MTELKSRFNKKQGVFVTIHKNKELRGCIGFPEPIFPLYDAIKKAALYAAFEDPRFHPLRNDEYEDIEFELSILTVPEPVNKPYEKNIKVGEDGLIIRAMGRSGHLLPQVATEYNWSPEEFLGHTCQKAGLSDDAWKNDDIEILSFQAEIFSENAI